MERQMDITGEQIERAIELLGRPEERDFGVVSMLDPEIKLVKWSVEQGRSHDVTMFIESEGSYVCIQKPSYKGSGIFRAPSGGVEPGEGIAEGGVREAYEETGLKVEPVAFPLLASVKFQSAEGELYEWKSFVLLANALEGELSTNDPREICAVEALPRERLQGEIRRRMLDSGWGGFLYRARLTDAFFEALDRQNGKEIGSGAHAKREAD